MADLTRIKKIKCTENHEHEIDAIAWDGYETSNLATIDGRNLLGGGDIATMEEVTYEELVWLRNGGYLIPGKQYRIIDYDAAVSGNQTILHPFDIIVTADTTNSLNEKARACIQNGDTYFSENGANLDAWQIWYCLDNDINRFSWAHYNVYGRGVIYRMIDEWGNDCPYDFKNIQFGRWCYESADDLPTVDCVDENAQTRKMFYTFSYIDENGEIHDYSVKGNNGSIAPVAPDIGVGVYKNIIAPHYIYTDWVGNSIDYPRQTLNNIVFVTNTMGTPVFENTFDIGCYNNTLGSMSIKNIFGYMCYNNTLGVLNVSNVFGGECYNNVLGEMCGYNIFGHQCDSNILGENCFYNHFEGACTGNELGGYSRQNSFGSGCQDNIFGEGCGGNTFGENCLNNTFGNNCGDNTFGNDCDNNTFGEECSKNTLGIKCTHNTFHSSCGGNTFGTNCDSNILYGNNVVNTFGNTCYSNTLGVSSSYNIFGNLCSNNIFDGGCYKNILSNSCVSNQFNADCIGNSLGSECTAITLFSGCKYNSFGNACANINLGERCNENSFGNYCQYNNFQVSSDYEWPLNRCCSNHFDDGCSFIRIVCNKRNNSDYLKNININRGVRGTSQIAREIIFIHNINSENEINVYNDKGHIYVDYGDINVTYEQLKTLVANKQLTPGRDYRIIDYVTTTSQEDTKSAGHQFDIIVTALDESTLSEEAKAIQHDGDDYFANSNLSAWKIWYSFDNDTNKFAWAGNSRVDKTYTKLEYIGDCEYAITVPYHQNGDDVEYPGLYEFEEWVVVRGKIVDDPAEDMNYNTMDVNEVFSHWNIFENADGDYYIGLHNRRIDGDYLSGVYVDGGLSSTAYKYDGVRTVEGVDYDSWLEEETGKKIHLLTDRIVTTKSENPYFYTHSETVEFEPKGIIYRMIDEFNNDCPYDFKNILFTRYGLVENNLFDSVLATGEDMYLESLSNNVKLLFDERYYINLACGFTPNGRNWNGDGRIKSDWDGNTVDLYTFTFAVKGFSDATILNLKNIHPPRDNKIEILRVFSDMGLREHLALSNNVFIYNGSGDTCENILSFQCEKNTIIGGSHNIFERHCTNNILMTSSYNIFGRGSHANILGGKCNNITLGELCEYNSFFDAVDYISLGNGSIYNAFSYSISHFTFGDGCSHNCISDNSTDCNFDSDCSYNILYNGGFINIDFGKNCWYNKIYSGCREIVFGDDCRSNIINQDCFNIYFGNTCEHNEISPESGHNIFGNKCDRNKLNYGSSNNTFGSNCTYNTVDNGFGNAFGSNCAHNTLEMRPSTMDTGCSYNYFESGCESNTLGYKSCNNYFSANCRNNGMGYNSNYNSFGNSCHVNTLGNTSDYNSFGAKCNLNVLGDNAKSNTFGSVCANNTFSVNCMNNSMGNDCTNNTVGSYCRANSFGNMCKGNMLGNYNSYNSFGNACLYNGFKRTTETSITQVYNNVGGSTIGMVANGTPLHFTTNVHFGDGCEHIILVVPAGAIQVTSVNNLTNCYITQGIKSKLTSTSGVVSYKSPTFIMLYDYDLNSDGLLFTRVVGGAINKYKLSDLLPA